MRLTDFKVLTFDCYGTLIDWETRHDRGAEAADPQGRAAASRATRYWRPMRVTNPPSSATRRRMRYSELLAVVYKRLAEEWGVAPTWDECLAYGRSVKDWPAFADSAERASLPQAALQARHPVERRQRELCPQRQEARRSNSTRSSPPRTSAPTSRTRETSNTCSKSSPASASPRPTFCIPPKACSTIMRRPTISGSRHAGSVVATAAGVRRHDESGRHAAARLPLHQHGRYGENPP